MNPVEFIRTVYVGDRACKALTIDGWNAEVRVCVDAISRIRSVSGAWDFYTAEDILDGILVFVGVTAFELKNDGYLPNDSINSIEATERDGGGVCVEMSIDAVEADARHHETIVRFNCMSVHIEDPARPGIKIST